MKGLAFTGLILSPIFRAQRYIQYILIYSNSVVIVGMFQYQHSKRPCENFLTPKPTKIHNKGK